MPATPQSPLALADRAQLFTHLAAMEQAGMPADKSFALLELPLAAQASLTRMRQQLSQGQDLASAGQRAGLFTALEVTLLQATLSAGSPATLYRRLAEGYRQKARNAAALRSRLWMPALVFAIALFIQPLPRLVDGSLGVGAYLWTCLQPLLLVVGGVWLVRQGLAWLMSARPSSRRDQAERLLLALPLFGVFQRRCAARDFFESLGLMLEAGVPMFDALPKAVATIGNAWLRAGFVGAQRRVLAGESLAQALQPLDFPDKSQALGLIRSGEGSGALPAMLLRHAQSETRAVDAFQEQMAVWAPRLVYGLLLLWMAHGLLSGSAFQPNLPPGL